MQKEKDWEAIAASPKFQTLVSKKRRVLVSLMLFSITYYFMLPLGANLLPELFKQKVWGPLNVGLLFALSEFIVAWGVAITYTRIANRTFDTLAAEIIADAQEH